MQSTKSFTQIDLVVVIAIVIFAIAMAFILTPGRRRGSRDMMPNSTQVRTIAQAMMTYASQNRDRMPGLNKTGEVPASEILYSDLSGPDGGQYAVGGHVNIDTSAENDPRATIQKMQVVRRAALAPGDPSGTDRRVAAQAAQTLQKAQMELRRQSNEEAGAVIDVAA
jgi:type II secretory pathway pseudopilin PulG